MTDNNQIIAAASSGLFKYLYTDGHPFKKQEVEKNVKPVQEKEDSPLPDYKEIFRRFVNRIDSNIDKTASSNEPLSKWIIHLNNLLDTDEVDWKAFLADFNYMSDKNISEARKNFHKEFYQLKIASAKPFFNVLVCDDLFIYSLRLYSIIERIFYNLGITNPVIHFDFEYDPDNVGNRCRDKKYDLILLDIDYSVLGNDRMPAREIAKWAREQDPPIPIIVSSKYTEVEYYKDLLSNVICILPKAELRYAINKVLEDEKIEGIVLSEFLYPILIELVKYYKLAVYHYEKQTIFQFKPGSTYFKSGVYDKIEFDKNIVEIPNNLEEINEDKLKGILHDTSNDSKKSLFNYMMIPRLNKDKKLNLLFAIILPEEIKDASIRLRIEERLKNYGYGASDFWLYPQREIKFSIDENKFKYELFTLDIKNELSIGTVWEGLESTSLPTCLMKDLEYMVIPKLNKMSLLDIIGPIMIGPSSSHTAGANRIGRLARNFGIALINKNFVIDEIEVKMLNSFDTTGNGHGSNKAIAAGLLGLPQYSSLLKDILENSRRSNEPGSNLVKSKNYYEEIKGVDFAEEPGFIRLKAQEVAIKFTWYNSIEPNLHNNSIRFVFKSHVKDDNTTPTEFILEAQSWGGGNIQISSIRKRIGNEEANMKVKINGTFEDFYFTKEELATIRHLLNGKEKIELNEMGLIIDEIYKDSSLEVIEAIKEFDKNYEGRNSKLIGFTLVNNYKPNFIGLDDLEKVGKDRWLWEIAILYERWYGGNKINAEKIYQVFSNYVQLMIKLAEKHSTSTSTTENFDRNDAYKLLVERNIEKDDATLAMIYAIGVNEANAKFRLVLAAPTAGSCGVIPGVLKVMDEFLMKKEEYKNINERYKLLTEALLISSLVGLVITNVVPPAGASHGCQAEVGTAGAMASSLCAYIHCRVSGEQKSKTAKKVIHAAAIALKTSLGLVCDPLGGKVEDPCIKRSGMKASEAIQIGKAVSKDLESQVSPSDVVSAMKEIGENMSVIYKETSRGGLASTLISRTLLKR